MIDNLISIIEAILLSSDKPLSVERIASVFDEHDGVDKADIRTALKTLQARYQQNSFDLVEVASGYRIQVSQGYSHWIAKLWEEKPLKYSRALLETLAIIAYQQPVTRGEVEAIRGVSVSSNIVRTLLERGWIRSVGHKEVPGRPEIFATTKEFLDHFNLQKMSQLPPLEELQSWQTDLTDTMLLPQTDQAKVPSETMSATNNNAQQATAQDKPIQDASAHDSVNAAAKEFHAMQDEEEQEQQEQQEDRLH